MDLAPQQTSAGSDAPGRARDALHLCLAKPRPPTRPLLLSPGDKRPNHSSSHPPPCNRHPASAHPSSPKPSLVESKHAAQRESWEDAKMLNQLCPAAQLCIIFDRLDGLQDANQPQIKSSTKLMSNHILSGQLDIITWELIFHRRGKAAFCH